ncbi:MAG: inositol monophosphatase family protein [Anaerolineae bacterium]
MLELAIEASRAAGRELLRLFQQPMDISSKGLRDIQTEADLAAENAVVALLQQRTPEAAIITEEDPRTPRVQPGQLAWYIDPLDGTTNYARGLPGFSVSIAAARDGVPEYAVVYDPLLQLTFSAQRGHGAFLNGERLQVSHTERLQDALVLLDWPREPSPRQAMADMLRSIVPDVDAVRSRGSAAFGMCAVAAGWADAYFQLTLQPWDVAAGSLIVEEAGGKVTDLAGKASALTKPDWLASNGRLHEAVLAYSPRLTAAP